MAVGPQWSSLQSMRVFLAYKSQATRPDWWGAAFTMSLTDAGAFHLSLSHPPGLCRHLQKQSHQHGRRRHTQLRQAQTWKWLSSLGRAQSHGLLHCKGVGNGVQLTTKCPIINSVSEGRLLAVHTTLAPGLGNTMWPRWKRSH